MSFMQHISIDNSISKLSWCDQNKPRPDCATILLMIMLAKETL